MASTFWGLEIGKTALYAYQAALNTTGHNISNAGVQGYSRQLVGMQAGQALRTKSSLGMMGSGVQVTSIHQIRSEYYDMKYRSNNSVLGGYQTKNQYLSQIENHLNEIKTEDGFTKAFDSFFLAIDSAGKNAGTTGLPERSQVTNYAQAMTEAFNSVANSLKKEQEEANFQIEVQVKEINSIAQQITSLNRQINVLEGDGSMANDLRDERNRLIDKLSTFAKVETEERKVGSAGTQNEFYVRINGTPLVSNTDCSKLELVTRKDLVNQNDVQGLFDIKWENGTSFDPFSVSGSLQALFELRDGNNLEGFNGVASGTQGSSTITVKNASINSVEKMNMPPEGVITVDGKEYKYASFDATWNAANNTYEYTFNLKDPLTQNITNGNAKIGEKINYKGVPYYMSKLNEFSRTFTSQFNELHKKGFDLNGNEGIDFFNAIGKVDGEEVGKYTESAAGVVTGPGLGNFNKSFNSATDASYYLMTADNLSVTKFVSKDPSRVAIADEKQPTGGESNSGISQQIMKLKSDSGMFKEGTPSSFLQVLISAVGIDAKSADDFEENQSDVLESIAYQRYSVSGVDEEEEGMNMIRYKYAYDLSSKIISVMNQIYDKLINEMGV